MKSFDYLNRRTHLYLGLFIMPWLMMYGVSSFMLCHPAWFRSEESAQWQPVFEREYQRDVPKDANLREVGNAILSDCNLQGAFWANRPKPDEIQVTRFRFRDATRLSYSIKEHRLRAERQEFKLGQLPVRLHFRGGFQQPTFWDTLWAVLVDVACLGILIWVGSGVLMWWRLRALRLWGTISLAGGLLSFALLIWRL